MSHLFTATLQMRHRSGKLKWTQILRDVADEVISDLSFTAGYRSR